MSDFSLAAERFDVGHGMSVVLAYPPNYAAIQKAFDLSAGRKPMFAWGNLIYNPESGGLDDHVVAHEAVHCRQQLSHTGGIEGWWAQYIADPEFRLRQEIEAYKAQALSARAGIKDRNESFRYVRQLSLDLSSPLYGDQMPRSIAFRLLMAGI